MQESKKKYLKVFGTRIAVCLGICYLCLCFMVYFMQEEIIFVPTVGAPFNKPTTIELAYEDFTLKSDEYNIHVWYVPSKANRGTVLFSHGNAGNLGHRLDTIRIWNELGMNILLYDYRGFGKSEGRPTEEGCYEDVKVCYEWLKENKPTNGPFILHGRSLGGGAASWAAENLGCDGLVLESTFTSVPDMGSHKFPFLPIGLLSTMDFPTEDIVGRLKCPIAIFHSKDDEIIPYYMGDRLAKKAGVEMNLLKGSHNSGFSSTLDYPEKLNEFILELK